MMKDLEVTTEQDPLLGGSKEKTLDDVLEELGGFGRFQWLLILCVSSGCLMTGWSILQMSYSGLEPHWNCIRGNVTGQRSPHYHYFKTNGTAPALEGSITSGSFKHTKLYQNLGYSQRESSAIEANSETPLKDIVAAQYEAFYGSTKDSLSATVQRSGNNESNGSLLTLPSPSAEWPNSFASDSNFGTSDEKCFDKDNNKTYEECTVSGHSCHQFCFEGSEKTVVTEWDLVCDKKWIKQLMTSVQMAGVLIGSLLFGQLSDRFGRKHTLYSALLFHMVMNIVAGFSVSWEMYTICLFFLGVFIGGQITVNFPLLVEYLTPRWRALAPSIPFFNLGSALLALVAYLLKDWSHLHFALAAVSALVLPGWFYFPESVRWLAVHGRLEEALAALEKVAQCNRRTVPLYSHQVLEDIATKEKELRSKSAKYTYADLFRTRKMAVTTTFVGIIWLSVNIVFYGVSFGASSLGGSVYVNILLMSLIDIPFNFFSVYLINRSGRKKTEILFLSLTVLSTVSLIIVAATAPDSIEPTLTTIFILSAKMTSSPSFATIYIWGVELYPTVVRNLAFGLSSMAGRVGGIIAPFAVDLDERAVPSYIIMASVMFLSLVLAFWLPETKGVPLPDQLAGQGRPEEESDTDVA